MAKYTDVDQVNRIPVIVSRETCDKHDASHAQPCWYIYTSQGTRLLAICNARAIRAGYLGEINENSLRKGRYGQ